MEQVRIERLDHLGLIASVIKDLGLIASKYSSNPWPEIGGGTPCHHGAGIDRARRSRNSGYPFCSYRAGERCARPVWQSPR